MSRLAVKVERIRSVEKHPNADRLDLVQINDWHCVTKRGTFVPGDLAVYIPIDSILPADFEAFLFPLDSKVRLHKSRVKTIKLRGAISQGMVVNVDAIYEFLCESKRYPRGQPATNVPLHLEGQDLTAALGVTKYEPPEVGGPLSTRGQQAPKKHKNPFFKEYTDLDNGKHYPNVFEPGEQIVATEKIHGTNFRAGYVPYNPNTLWKRIRKFLGFAPEYEFVYGSRRVQLQNNASAQRTGFYSRVSNGEGPPPGNVYAQIVRDWDLYHLIPKGYIVYGEIYGDGIQKGYTYGCKPGQRELAVFDVAKVSRDGSQRFLDNDDMEVFCDRYCLDNVPVIYVGPYESFEQIKALTVGPSVLAPEQNVREGVVAKPVVESTHPMIGRKILKFVSDTYLLKEQSEFH